MVAVDAKLTGPQYAFLTNDAQFRGLLSGIGAGKTTVGLLAGVKEAVEQPGAVGVVVAPTYPLIRDVLYPELDKWLPPELIKDFSRHENTLELRNGSMIRFRSAENDRQIERLRGPSICWYWLDEVTLMPKIAWDIMLGRLRQIGYKCRAWVTGTPRGFDWVYDLFIAHPAPDRFILSNVPSRSNVYLSPDYFKNLERQYTGQFARQELLGEFVQFEGLVYPEFTHELLIEREEIPATLDHIVYGVDWGYSNPACVLALGAVGNTTYVLEEFYQARVTDDELVRIAKQLQDRWGAGTFYCDPSEPASIDKFNRAGIRAEKANNDVNAGIRAVASAISRKGLLVNRSCSNTVNEFRMYSFPETRGGDTRELKDAPVKVHDHAMDALRYGIMGMDKGQGGIINFGGIGEAFRRQTPRARRPLWGCF